MSKSKELIDYEFGLAQLGGNQALFDKMLGKFIDEFSDSDSYITSKIQEGHFSDAKIKAHTTKGISGNLGMRALYKAATELDAELKQGSANDSTLEYFREVLTGTIESLTQHIAKQNSDGESTTSKHSNESASQNLLDKLTRNEFIDDEELDELISSLSLDNESIKKLVDSITTLNYKAAIEILKQ